MKKEPFAYNILAFNPTKFISFFLAAISLFFLHKAKLFYYYSKDLFFPLAVEALCDAFSAKSVTKEKKGRRRRSRSASSLEPQRIPTTLKSFFSNFIWVKKKWFQMHFFHQCFLLRTFPSEKRQTSGLPRLLTNPILRKNSKTNTFYKGFLKSFSQSLKITKKVSVSKN